MITFVPYYAIPIEIQIDKMMQKHKDIQQLDNDCCVAGKMFLGKSCSKVMMLVVLMMTALTNTFAYDQWHLSAADIETGKALILQAVTDSTWEFFPTLLFLEKSTRLYKMYCL